MKKNVTLKKVPKFRCFTQGVTDNRKPTLMCGKPVRIRVAKAVGYLDALFSTGKAYYKFEEPENSSARSNDSRTGNNDPIG